MPEDFHQRGHHVQSAHGRRTALANGDASAVAHTGCMIALMPTPADAKRLAVKGGEAAAELHCTLYYLGPNASIYSADLRAGIIAAATDMLGGLAPVQANIFGIGHWNGTGSSPSWIWNIGDDPAVDCPDLEHIHGTVDAVLDAVLGSDPDDVNAPDQHTPWAAHICAAYTDDLTLAPTLEKALGPVTFDRVRVSFGSEDTDIPLSGSSGVTAAAKVKPPKHPGEFRRLPNATEQAAKVDFAQHQRSWDTAVSGALHDWKGITADWRNQIYNQISLGGADDLGSLSVDTSAAAEVLYQRMTIVAQAAGKAQQREAEQQGVTVGDWSLTASLKGLDLLRSVSQLTSRTLGTRLVQSAVQRAMSLLGTFSGIRLASEIEQFLQSLTDAFEKQWLGNAMSSAQNAGRIAVLEAAPAATYYATELMDDRTCSNCTAIDGKAFSSLDDAESAYPGGGYIDCLGGGNCRGTIYAVWDQGMLASAEEETTVTTVTEEELGGKPSTGTAKDKRLKANKPNGSTAPGSEMSEINGAPCADCPDDAAHFASGPSVSDAPWDGAASRFSDQQYKTASAACDPGDEPPKTACFLPHHEPDGELSRAGLGAAAGRFSGLKGHSPAAVAAAKSHLVAHYHAIGEPVPDNLSATGHSHLFVPEPAAPAPVAMPEGGQTAPWEGVLAPEGKTSGDGREFAPDALTWRDLPIPLRWNRVDSHGGEPRTEAVNVGRIDSINRDGGLIKASGVFDLSTPDGQTAYSKVQNQMLRGVSIDADSIKDADVEMIYPQVDGEDPDADPFLALFAPPDKVIYHGGRISAATLCDIPAFAEAYIQLTDPDTGSVVAGGAMDPAEWEAAQPEPEALVAYAAPVMDYAPPAEWFENPGLNLWTDITVTADGRVYGHAAAKGSCHIGYANQCVTMPVEDQHAYYLTGEILCDDDTTVAVGQITIATGHASPNAGAQAAVDHYDHTGAVVADVTCGNDSVGIWVAGAIRPDADPAKVAALRASGRVSGDWRRIGGKLRLVGLLGVNVGGFAAPSPRVRVASGVLQSLVAAGSPPPRTVELSEEDLDQQAMQRVMAMLVRKVKR
jgi:hypothetical protein